MYALSVSAVNQYRNGAKRGANIPLDILKIKLNCLCRAGNEVDILFGKRYDFGSFSIEVKNNIIKKVYWDNRRDPNVSKHQGERLIALYKRNGLNEAGNGWL